MASLKYFERLLVVATVFFICLVIMMVGLPMIMSAINFGNDTREGLLILSVLQAVIVFIIPSFISARIISRRPIDFTGLNKAPHWLAVLGVIFAYLIALPALNQIIYWNANISFPDSIAHWGETLRAMEDKANEASQKMLDVTSFGGLIANMAVIGLLTAFGEELFFRGTLQRTAVTNGMHHTAIWVVALLFSALHFQIFGFIPRLILGAWFGYLFFWTRSLYVPIIAHFINNSVVVLCAWFVSRGVTFDFDKLGVTEYGFPIPAFVSALATIVFLIYFRKFFFYRGRKDEDKSNLGKNIGLTEEEINYV